MTDETTPTDREVEDRHVGVPPMTEEEAARLDAAEAEDWWRQAPMELQPFLRVLATPMNELGFDSVVTAGLEDNMPLGRLLAIGDMEHIAYALGGPWCVWRFRDRFEEPFLIGDLGIDMQATMDIGPFLPYLKAGGFVPEDA